jgi:hypothetical protein
LRVAISYQLSAPVLFVVPRPRALLSADGYQR